MYRDSADQAEIKIAECGERGGMIYLFKGLLIGLIFGTPVGAIGAMTIHRTITRNLWAGIITGIGSSVADCLYASVGAFGVTFISGFLTKNQLIINVAGGLIIMFMGIMRFFQETKQQQGKISGGGISLFLSAFTVAIMNPVLVMSFMFAFSFMGIAGVSTVFNKLAIVTGVFVGTIVWWAVLLSAVEYLKRKKGSFNMKFMNKIFGVVFILLAAGILIKAFM